VTRALCYLPFIDHCISRVVHAVAGPAVFHALCSAFCGCVVHFCVIHSAVQYSVLRDPYSLLVAGCYAPSKASVCRLCAPYRTFSEIRPASRLGTHRTALDMDGRGGGIPTPTEASLYYAYSTSLCTPGTGSFAGDTELRVCNSNFLYEIFCGMRQLP
jgi:hypothetical protein